MTILTPSDVAERLKCRTFGVDAWGLALPAVRSGALARSARNRRQNCVGLLGPEHIGWELLVAEWGQKAVAIRSEVGIHWTSELTREAGFVYFIASPRAVKIGRSVDVPGRVGTLQRYNPDRLRVLGVLPGANELERALHRHFAKLRIVGEWFRDCEELRDLISIYCEERYLRRCGILTARKVVSA